MVTDICRTDFKFDNFNKVADYFKDVINICRQMNYAEFKSDKFKEYYKELQNLLETKAHSNNTKN
jgi:V/A-type H+-transporting ATPase subunit A